MADIKISELGAASAVNATDLFPMTASGVTVKATAQQIKNYMGVGNLTDLSTTDKTSVIAAINEVDGHADIVQEQVSNSGDAYSSSKAYAVGDLCIYNNTLYRCTTACSAGSWSTNQSCFTADTLVNAINNRQLKLTVFSKNTASLSNGDASLNVDLPSSYSKIVGIFPVGWSPRDSWSTSLIITNVNITNMAIYFRINDASISQIYAIRYIVLYY